VTGETIRICFGGGSGLAGDRSTSRSGGARRAFAGLFAATAALTGAVMTARTVTRAAAAPDNCRSACGRRAGTSCSGCRDAREFRNGFRAGGPERKKARRRIDIGLVFAALPTRLRIPRQTLPAVLSGENSESVADVYLQPVHEHGAGAE